MTEEIDTLAEVQSIKEYEEVTNINVDMESFNLHYNTNKSDMEKYLCSFEELLNQGVPEFDNITLYSEDRRELVKLKDDLDKYWNNNNEKLYKLKYNYKNGNLPYKIYLPFESDLINNKEIIKTHDKEGNFISDHIYEQIDNITKLDTYNIYGDFGNNKNIYNRIEYENINNYNNNNTNNKWKLYSVENVDSNFEKYKIKLYNHRYRIDVDRLYFGLYGYASLIVLLLLTLPLLILYHPINIINVLLLLIISPPWVQNLVHIELLKLILSLFKVTYKFITDKKQYKFKKFLDV